MLIAAIGDCNGNVAALRTALAAISGEGILTIFQTGNLAGSAGTDAIIGLLREHGVLACQGEQDRQLLRFEQKAATLRNKVDDETFAEISATHASLSSGGLEFLRSLHKRIELTLEGIRMLSCHGSPASQQERIDAESPVGRLQRHREAAHADIIICGGAGEPFHRWVDGTLFAGPGPLSPEPGQAGYILINTEESPWRVEPRVLPAGPA